MDKIYGSHKGLKPAQLRQLSRLYSLPFPLNRFLSIEFGERLAALSAELETPLCVYANRRGQVVRVGVGTPKETQFSIDELPRQGTERLSGLRCIATQFDMQGPNRGALTALALQRLDALVILDVAVEGFRRRSAAPSGFVQRAQIANLVPDPLARWVVSTPQSLSQVAAQDFDVFLEDLEDEFRRTATARAVESDRERVLLVDFFSTRTSQRAMEEELSELVQLVTSAGGEVLKVFYQRRAQPDPSTLIGQGKLEEVALSVQDLGANLVVCGRELTPTQGRNLEQAVGVRVVDRNELILDIFARRARSHEGKLQVELAQLQYLLPRLTGRGGALSRLGGGIGTRGPGETKLETDRRIIRRRIAKLQLEVNALQAHRARLRARRQRKEVPVFALVGYTNAGKSTLLNTLTDADALVADQLFATLDPTTRRLELPTGDPVLLTDTVGFIHDLPPQLIDAFRATLEEVTEADALLHVVDLSNPAWMNHIQAVQRILESLPIATGPQLLVFNKVDRVSPELRSFAEQEYPLALFISAQKGWGFLSLRQALLRWVRSLTDLPLAESSIDGEP
ncbi:GTPase HflX [Gloeobacter kilaueensis]|uniref:GTPase HflX n=1 Tax=Gloeobacter kilaueensis TaxID=1416614 RepID=UPI0006880831